MSCFQLLLHALHRRNRDVAGTSTCTVPVGQVTNIHTHAHAHSTPRHTHQGFERFCCLHVVCTLVALAPASQRWTLHQLGRVPSDVRHRWLAGHQDERLDRAAQLLQSHTTAQQLQSWRRRQASVTAKAGAGFWKCDSVPMDMVHSFWQRGRQA